MKLKRLLLIIGGLVLLAVILCVGGALVSGAFGGQSTPTPAAGDEADVPTEVSIRARGEIVPAVWADLSFDASGQVAEWLVEEGDVVEAGAPLGRLDTESLEMALLEAQMALDATELKLAQAQADLERQLAEAQLALETAEARLVQAQARYPSLAAAAVHLQAAIEAEERAWVEYDKAIHRPWDPDTVTESYRLAYEAAVDERELAQAEYDSVLAEQRASSQELIVLEGEVQKAHLALAKLEEGVDPLLAQDVESAELQVTQAQADLEAATLAAPFGGTVVELHLKEQDWAQPGTPAITVADLSTLRVETTDLDEWAAAQVPVGGEATIVFTAFDDKTLTGHVTEIALRGEELPAGDVVYRAVIELDVPDPDLRWGMTVRITIPIE
ncbi:MAG: efflux RND transporter periplasmic adaptor subunit [Anaerolineae bacterium]|nr:efflux RND transporter periplasmic adaptor subunit [Anaerolineae bacterium]